MLKWVLITLLEFFNFFSGPSKITVFSIWNCYSKVVYALKSHDFFLFIKTFQGPLNVS